MTEYPEGTPDNILRGKILDIFKEWKKPMSGGDYRKLRLLVNKIHKLCRKEK